MFLNTNYKNLRKQPTKLIHFPTNAERKDKYALAKFWDAVLEDFLRVSTVPAMQRIFRKTSKLIERLLWSFGFVTACFILTYVTLKIDYIYRHRPLKTVISDLQFPIFRIPFPEITICNKNRLNWQRYNEAKTQFVLPQHRTPQHEQLFMEVVNAYDKLYFGNFDKFKNLSNLYPPLLLRDLNYINFTRVVELMAWRCHEIFSECSWINRSMDCCEIFTVRRSQQGQCLAFNSVEMEEGKRRMKSDPYYPWRTMGMGPKNGLRFRIHTREGLHSPLSRSGKGVMLMMVEPHVWSYLPHEIPTNTRTTVSISAYLHFYDKYTRIFPQHVRSCVFEDELGSLYYKSLQDHKYMYENCQSECQQEYLMQFCNCTVDLFYPPGRYRACQLTDLPCLYEHNDILQNVKQVGEEDYVAYHDNGMNCPCYYNCKSLSYFPDFNVDNIPNDQVDFNNTEIEMSIYFLLESLKVYKTTVVYTFIDLMASLGGLAGLCIGCSLVGIVELLYFFLVDLPKEVVLYYRSNKRLKRKRRTVKAKQILVKEFVIMP